MVHESYMENLRVDAQFLPPTLYRIQYGVCQTTWNETGLCSASMDTPDSSPDIIATIRAQLDWHERTQLTSFSSEFDDEEVKERHIADNIIRFIEDNYGCVFQRLGVTLKAANTAQPAKIEAVYTIG